MEMFCALGVFAGRGRGFKIAAGAASLTGTSPPGWWAGLCTPVRPEPQSGPGAFRLAAEAGKGDRTVVNGFGIR